MHLEIDLMYVNRLPFLVTVSRFITFTTIEFVRDRSHQRLITGITHVERLYTNRGFRVAVGYADNEFRGLADSLKFTLNVTSTDEHMPMVEHRIRVIRSGCVQSDTRFRSNAFRR